MKAITAVLTLTAALALSSCDKPSSSNASSPPATPPAATSSEPPPTATTPADSSASSPSDTTSSQSDSSAEPTIPEGFTAVAPLSETRKTEFAEADYVLQDGMDYQALVQTDKGNLRLELYEDQTPVTVNNFVFLARNKFYDGIVFHRVIDGFMAQTGDPLGNGTGGPGYQFGDEIRQELKFDTPGLLAMANAGPGTNGSQFFVTYAQPDWLNGKHTIFGKLLEGSDVLNSLEKGADGAPVANPSKMLRVTIIEKKK